MLVHDVINYGVLICAFYGNVTPQPQQAQAVSQIFWYFCELPRQL
jgi:hypothetical protein